MREENLTMNNTDQSKRPDIPDPIKREIRHRCGFGCVVCGLPLYTYEHMLGYANVQRHVAKEMTLLCDKHQRERTNKLLPIEYVENADKNPYNLRKGVSAPYTLHYYGSDCFVDIGTNTFLLQSVEYGSEFVAFAIDDDPLISFRFDSGHWLLNLNIFDKDGNRIMQIADNELSYSVIPWDIELIGHNLIIREAQGKILIDLLFEPPSKIKIQRGRLFHNGIGIEIKKNCFQIMNNLNMFSGNSTEGLTHGILIGDQKRPNIWGFWVSVATIHRYIFGPNSAS